MTDKTYPITVHLNDEQLKSPSRYDLYKILYEAVLAQRPRPIAVGDRVTCIGGPRIVLDVEAIKDGIAWVWYDGSPRGSHHTDRLTRVDDGAKP